MKKKAREIDLNRFNQGLFVSIVFLSLENLKVEYSLRKFYSYILGDLKADPAGLSCAVSFIIDDSRSVISDLLEFTSSSFLRLSWLLGSFCILSSFHLLENNRLLAFNLKQGPITKQASVDDRKRNLIDSYLYPIIFDL